MKKVLSLILAIAMIFSFAACAKKEDAKEEVKEELKYPEMAITINTHKAATNLDYVARALSVTAKDYWGANMVVNNTSGIIDGMRATLTADPDGYTLTVSNTSALVSDALGKTDFSVIDDFTVIGMLGYNCANWVAVTAEFAKANNITSIQDLITYSKANPGKLTITDKQGTNTNVVVLGLLKAGLDAVAVDGDQGNARVANILNGTFDVFVGPWNGIKQYVENDTLVCLCSCSKERSEYTPNIPCSYELGINVECQSWYYLAGPKNMDAAVVEKISDLIKHASEDKTFIDTSAGFESVPIYMTPDETTAYLKEVYQNMKNLGLGKK